MPMAPALRGWLYRHQSGTNKGTNMPTKNKSSDLAEAKSALVKLTRPNLIKALLAGPRASVPPQVHQLRKADLQAALRHALARGGVDARRIASVLLRARMDRDLAIARGERTR
jgi:hypothetical protein